MRIAIMGAGGIGCYVGGRHAAAGHDVTFIARGPQLEALTARGLTVKSPLGDIAVPTVTATHDPAEVGPVDVVVMGVKLYDLESATRAALVFMSCCVVEPGVAEHKSRVHGLIFGELD